MKKQSLITGSLVLAMAGIISKILGIFFRWPIINLIGDEGMGLYQTVAPLMIFLIGAMSGIPVAIAKLISENEVNNKTREKFAIMDSAFKTVITFGLVIGIALIVVAKPVIVYLKWSEDVYYAWLGIAFAPLVVSLLTVYKGFFQGLRNMTSTGMTQILEQLFRVIGGILLVYLVLPKGIGQAAGAASLGTSIGAIVGLIYLHSKYVKYKKENNIRKINKKESKAIWTKIMKLAAPISATAMVVSLGTLIETICTSRELIKAGLTLQDATILYGQFSGKAAVIIALPLTLATSLSVVIVPVIASACAAKNKRAIKKNVDMVIKLIGFVVMPASIGIFILAKPIMMMLFGKNFGGYEILRFMAIAIPFMGISQVTTALLQGIGHIKEPIINNLIGCALKLALTLTLVKIPSINIYGAIGSTIAMSAVVSILNVISIYKKEKIIVDWFNSLAKPLYSAIAMGGVVVLGYRFVVAQTGSSSISCLTSVFLGIIVYIALIILMRVFTMDEIKARISKN